MYKCLVCHFRYIHELHMNRPMESDIIIYLCTDNTALRSSHRGCSKDKIRPTLVLRPSTILFLLLFRKF